MSPVVPLLLQTRTPTAKAFRSAWTATFPPPTVSEWLIAVFVFDEMPHRSLAACAVKAPIHGMHPSDSSMQILSQISMLIIVLLMETERNGFVLLITVKKRNKYWSLHNASNIIQRQEMSFSNDPKYLTEGRTLL